jgi:dTDP-4-amino-4,6-dideoxygalactose transaminase
MWAYKDHGKSWEAVYERTHPPGFRWVHESFGTNWRMLEMQGVLGRLQLRKMAAWTNQRRQHAAAITAVAQRFGVVRVPPVPTDVVHAHYKHYLFVQPEQLAPGWTRDRIIEALAQRGVPCFQGSCSEVYLERAFDGTGYRPDVALPVAQELGLTSLMFLVHPTLTAGDIAATCTALAAVLEEASAHPAGGAQTAAAAHKQTSPA